MQKAGVPLVPGYHGEAQDEVTLRGAADRIGYPVLVKASAGGGGRGMRIVRSAAELTPAIISARREAKAAFGDDRMLIEKYVESPRHIEVQVIGDSHGNLLSLFERECTLQRRHQKVIEEAPSPTFDAAQRDKVCEAARKAAAAVSYVGAGTVEFVSDGKDTFFIEMNTRLQVEHPVTELITGIDLVEWQLRVAFGEKLPLMQNQIRLNGHAIEARVYAENPNKTFMPSVGRIKTWRTPPEVDGLRIDAGYREGDAVSPNYDAMLAKIVAWAPTREAAICRLNRGIEETDVRGVVTNIPFLSALVTHAGRTRQRGRHGVHRASSSRPDPAFSGTGRDRTRGIRRRCPTGGKQDVSNGPGIALANGGLDGGRPTSAAVRIPSGSGRARGHVCLWQWTIRNPAWEKQICIRVCCGRPRRHDPRARWNTKPCCLRRRRTRTLLADTQWAVRVALGRSLWRRR